MSDFFYIVHYNDSMWKIHSTASFKKEPNMNENLCVHLKNAVDKKYKQKFNLMALENFLFPNAKCGM